MKKGIKSTALIMMFAAALMATSCTDEANNATSIVGTWSCTANSAVNPSDALDPEVDNCFKGKKITFRTEGTYKATEWMLVGGPAEGFWSIADTSRRLYINSDSYWKIKELTAASLKIETYYVDGVGLTYDTAGVNINLLRGPYTRAFKRE